MTEFDKMMRKIAYIPGFDEPPAEPSEDLNAGEGTKDVYPAPRPDEENPFSIPDETPMQELTTDATSENDEDHKRSYALYINKLARLGFVLPSVLGLGALTAWMRSGKSKNTALTDYAKTLNNRSEQELNRQLGINVQEKEKPVSGTAQAAMSGIR